MRRFVIYIVWIAVIFGSGVLHAQDFTATVSKNPVGVGEQFEITFTLNTSPSGFQAPSFKDFILLGGPNQSTSMQFINGSMSQTVSYSYFLQAKTEGTFRIDPAVVNAGGKRLQSNSLSVTVVKGTPKQQGSNPQQQQGSETDLSLLTKNVFLRAIANKTTVTRGEPLLVTFKLYTRVSVLNVTTSKLPSFNGFWNQELKSPEQLDQHSETLNGISYKVATVKSMVLFPQQSGILTIDPMEGECIARVQVKSKRQNDPWGIFNDPFFGDPFGFGSVRDVKVPVKSDPLKITVKDLPPVTNPAFSGSVGKFTMEANLDKENVRSNDAVNLKIKIAGRGNIKLIESPEVTVPPDIEKYDPQVNENISASESGVTGSKTFTYVLIPRQGGNYIIDPVQFIYYDLDKKQYVTLKSSEFKLNVERGKDDGSAGSAVVVQNKADFKLIGKDIRFIKISQTTTGAILQTGNFYDSTLFYVLILFAGIVVICAILYKQHLNKISSNPLLMKSRSANRVAQRHLSSAKKLLQEKKNDLFYDEVYKALNLYAANKLGIDLAVMNKENLSASLAARNVKPELISKLISTLDSCEFARFASVQSGINPETIYSDAIQIISSLENELSA